QVTALNKQIADLTATQTANAKALAAKDEQLKTLSGAKEGDGKALAQLKQSLGDSQQQVTALNKQIADLTATQTANAKALAAKDEQLKTLSGEKEGDGKALAQLKQSLSESQQQADAFNKQKDELEKKWREAVEKLNVQDKQLADLRNVKPAISTAAPKNKEEIRAYAMGTLWGQEVVSAMTRVNDDGVVLNLQQVSSGVVDSINNSFKLPKEKIIAELDTINKEVLNHNRARTTSMETEGKKYINTFSKQPGVKRSAMGYYYQIIDKGEGKLKSDDVVGIVVKESLTNGKVITDMAKNGKGLALPLNNFPPLFSSALALMGNGGKMKLVVPPELAYGSQGRPPEIPPSSTMVYEVFIADVRPAKG
ncbi:FKBP-type peptidyl-prolyl cis-trans isomerase, partial [Citrobacter amalonaticus]|uniref:FKBP-type peptidyl-prolyl cis-trans isomerase n=1 Tax=Citrobacter amalonaticus TaxID=35703 RepID=UPI00300DAF83